MHTLDRILMKPEPKIHEKQVREVGDPQASSCEEY
jgi:hypothetical protein